MLTDPQGKASFPVDLTQGDDYQVEVTAVPQGYLLPSPAVQDALNLQPGEVRDLRFQVAKATATVNVYIVDGTGAPVPGAEVVIRLRV